MEQGYGCYTHLCLLNSITLDSHFQDMRYVEFIKSFYLADSNQLMAVKLTSFSWAQKRLTPSFWTWCTSKSWKIFTSPIRTRLWLLDSFRTTQAKKPVYSYYLDMMYVEFIKNIYLADSKKLMVDRLISVSSAKKRLFLTFKTWCTSSSWKIFIPPIPTR